MPDVTPESLRAIEDRQADNDTLAWVRRPEFTPKEGLLTPGCRNTWGGKDYCSGPLLPEFGVPNACARHTNVDQFALALRFDIRFLLAQVARLTTQAEALADALESIACPECAEGQTFHGGYAGCAGACPYCEGTGVHAAARTALADYREGRK